MDDEDAGGELLDRVARRETQERVSRIVGALRGAEGASPWAEVYRHAHTLAGIAEPVDAEVWATARDLAGRLRDERGRLVDLSDEERRAAEADVARLEAWLARAQT